MKKKILSIVITSAVLTLASCGNTNNNTDNTFAYNPQTFETDNQTIHKNNEQEILDNIAQQEQEKEQQQQDEENIDYGTPEYNTSEITIENEDTSVNYEIVGNDIIYRGITFTDLYTVVTSIEQPYDLNTFINFLVKTYNTHGETVVYSKLTLDDIETEDDLDIGAAMTISEQLYDMEGYAKIVEKYNGEEATWSISLYTYGGNNQHNIHGCKSYVLYNGENDIAVDMSEFDLSTEE